MAVLHEPRQAYGQLIESGRAPPAKEAFKGRARQVRGRHSKERTLEGRSERIEARRRAEDHANTPEGETSAQDAIDTLRRRHIITGGTDVQSVR